MKVAIIPARGGSKRIPRKNVRPFAGRPIIAWSIDAALQSGLFDRVIVSSDDPEIITLARALGAEAPFVRPPELADDHSSTAAVIAHAIGWLDDHGEPPALACCIYPTAPFTTAADLVRAHDLLVAGGWRFVFPAVAFPSSVYRGFRLRADGGAEMLFPEHLLTRTQDLRPVYHDAGQFYWGTREAWLGLLPVFAPHSCPIVIPRLAAQDIDTEEDWAAAEVLWRLTLER